MAPKLTASCDDSEVMPEAWRWMAPELIQTSMDTVMSYTQRVTQATDVWAFAMTVTEVCISRFSTPS